MTDKPMFIAPGLAVPPTREEARKEAQAAALVRARSDPATICPNKPQRVIAFAGDWHGDTQWAVSRLQNLGEEGIRVLLHVGDFGVWPGPTGKRFLDVVNKVADNHGIVVLVTPGNHEDWSRLDAMRATDRGDGWGAVKWLRDNVAVLPRAHRFHINVADEAGEPTGLSRSFVSLGGAPSIDYQWRAVGKTWWPTEAITEADVERTVAGGHADVMVAHDSPDRPYAVPRVEQILYSPSNWTAEGLAYAAYGRERMHDAYMGVEPKVFVHGHYHAPGVALVEHRGLTMHDPNGNKTGRGVVIALDEQWTSQNIVRLDLASLELVNEKTG